MTYASTSDLQNVTGISTDPSATVQQAILDDAERELTAYLKAKGVTASSADPCKSAELKLAQAGLILYRIQNGEYTQNAGEMVGQADPGAASSMMGAYRQLRRDAFEILDNYIAVQSSLNTPRARFVMKVN